jgi:FlaG/FlaF family flagellin (archaellin)
VKDLVRKSNKGASTMITIIGMIALLVIGLATGYYLNSGQTGTSQEFPEISSWLMENRNSSYK